MHREEKNWVPWVTPIEPVSYVVTGGVYVTDLQSSTKYFIAE